MEMEKVSMFFPESNEHGKQRIGEKIYESINLDRELVKELARCAGADPELQLEVREFEKELDERERRWNVKHPDVWMKKKLFTEKK